MSEPVFDFGIQGFKSSPQRIVGERARRIAEGKLRIEYGVSFVDHCTRGILRNDLVVIGAKTGAGKTELVTGIARRAAETGKRVHFFALEAEPDEIERRIKFREMCRIAYSEHMGIAPRLDYLDWRIGDLEGVGNIDTIENRADLELDKYKTLTTYYRGRDFDVDDVEKLFRAVKDQSDLIILDHLHYVDYDDSTSENAAIRRIVMTIRDVALDIGIPVIAIAHLRKTGGGGRPSLMPTLDDFHGTSEITKRATVVILLAPATDSPSSDPRIARTYITVAKHRARGASGIVARQDFHIPTRVYGGMYTLGRMSFKGDEFNELQPIQVPRWAVASQYAGRTNDAQ